MQILFLTLTLITLLNTIKIIWSGLCYILLCGITRFHLFSLQFSSYYIVLLSFFPLLFCECVSLILIKLPYSRIELLPFTFTLRFKCFQHNLDTQKSFTTMQCACVWLVPLFTLPPLSIYLSVDEYFFLCVLLDEMCFSWLICVLSDFMCVCVCIQLFPFAFTPRTRYTQIRILAKGKQQKYSRSNNKMKTPSEENPEQIHWIKIAKWRLWMDLKRISLSVMHTLSHTQTYTTIDSTYSQWLHVHTFYSWTNLKQNLGSFLVCLFRLYATQRIWNSTGAIFYKTYTE